MSTARPTPSLEPRPEPPIAPVVEGTETRRPWPRYDLEEPEDAAWICRSID